MTRKKKGLTPKRKPVVRRVGTKEPRWVEGGPNASGDGLVVVGPIVHNALLTAIQQRPDLYENAVRRYPRWSRVVAWVRDNPLDAAIAGVGFVLAVLIFAAIVRHG